MASSQANPAFSSTTESANPSNPITSGVGTSNNSTTTEDHTQKHKLFSRAPTTKDVESNNWVFGAQQAVSGPGDHSADNAGTDLGGLGPAGDGGNFTAGTAATGTVASSRLGVESGGAVRDIKDENVAAGNNEQGFGGVGGQGRYLAEKRERERDLGGATTTTTTTTGNGEAYQQGEERDYVGGDGFTGTTGGAGVTDSNFGGSGGPVGSTTGVYEGVSGREEGTGGYTGGAGGLKGSDYNGGVAGVNDDVDGEGKKKMNPLKKIVEAVKNI